MGVDSRFIRSLLTVLTTGVCVGNFFYHSLRGHHHKMRNKPFYAAQWLLKWKSSSEFYDYQINSVLLIAVCIKKSSTIQIKWLNEVDMIPCLVGVLASSHQSWCDTDHLADSLVMIHCLNPVSPKISIWTFWIFFQPSIFSCLYKLLLLNTCCLLTFLRSQYRLFVLPLCIFLNFLCYSTLYIFVK